MPKHYLIFERTAHSLIDFVQAETATEALWNYIAHQNPALTLEADGSFIEEGIRYIHPLAYIEAHHKVYGEWQIRELPDWAWQDSYAEVFCGESNGLYSVVTDCRELFARDYPGMRAKAFLWYLREGALVTFYRKRNFQIKVLKRYFWNWDGHKLTVREWQGTYEDIMEALNLLPFRGTSF